MLLPSHQPEDISLLKEHSKEKFIAPKIKKLAKILPTIDFTN